MNVCVNGEFFPAPAPVLAAGNRSFKWGDGVFETMKVFGGRLLLSELHAERLFLSLQLLQIAPSGNFTWEHLQAKILELCVQNRCTACARVRLAVYRNEANGAEYVIEALPLEESLNQWQEQGLRLVLFPFARKSMDAFANLKSANFLPYVMAQRYAMEQEAGDALVLNAQNFLCDSSRANVFLVKEGEVYTPALHQGCINGVMRRVVVDEAKKAGYVVHQEAISEEQLLQADEVFLTNAIQIMRRVGRYKDRQYGCDHSRRIFDAVAEAIFPYQT